MPPSKPSDLSTPVGGPAQTELRSWRAVASRWARAVGLHAQRQDYVRFIVLGRSRTGSNLLRGLLSSHPQVIVLGEILKNPDAIEWGTDGFSAPPQALDLYRRDPIAFLETYVFRPLPPAVRALGFKLFYYHARRAPGDRIWLHLETMARLRVIHVKRRNILRTHLSRAQAERSDRWVDTSGSAEAPAPITLDFETCRDDFEQTRRWETESDASFAGHPLLDLWYEDLVSDPEPSCQRLLDFLDLPHRRLTVQTRRQAGTPLSAAIVNYDELKRRFAGTPWAPFFEE